LIRRSIADDGDLVREQGFRFALIGQFGSVDMRVGTPTIDAKRP
jgi:hypothetical protein